MIGKCTRTDFQSLEFMFPCLPMRKTTRLFLTVFAALTAGCATYKPAPLDQKQIDAALAQPAWQSLRIASTNFHHPLLKHVVLDERDGISPDEAAIIAVISNPQLRAARNERGLAAAQIVSAGILPNPSLDASLDFPIGTEAPDNFKAYGFGFSWEITSLISRHAKMDSAKLHAASVDLDIAWQEWQVAQAARMHVLRLAAMHDELALARDLEKELAESIVTLRRAVETHNKPETELAAAEDTFQQTCSDRISLEQESATERLDLNATIGLPPDTVLKTATERTPLPSIEKNAAELFQSLETNRLDLLALRLGYESQEATLRAAVRSQFPKIGISVNLARDTANIKTRGIGTSIDLPFFDRNQGEINAETATRQQLYDEYIARLVEARADIAKIASDLDFARQQLHAAEAGIATAQRVADTAKAALERGNMDVLSFYDAQKTLASRKLETARRRRDIIELAIALETAAGQFFPTETPKDGKMK